MENNNYYFLTEYNKDEKNHERNVDDPVFHHYPLSLKTKLGIFVAVLGTVFCLLLVAIHFMRRPASTPYLKGQALAKDLGCFACHGEGGLGGVPNPTGDGSDVPSWDGGTAMMYLESDADIESYILHGERGELWHEEEEQGLIKMPPYKDLISKSQLADLVAYVKGVSRFYPGMPEDAKEGMGKAEVVGCFGCHGPSGRGGVHNPRSFKGVIPGWDGADFAKSVRSEEELEEWIREGITTRFRDNPLANFFQQRQQIKMPAYKDVLSEREIRSIMHYIQWMRGEPGD